MTWRSVITVMNPCGVCVGTFQMVLFSSFLGVGPSAVRVLQLKNEASSDWETELKLQKSVFLFQLGFWFCECSWLLWRGLERFCFRSYDKVTLFNSFKKNNNTLGLVVTRVASHFHFCNVLWLLSLSFILSCTHII